VTTNVPFYIALAVVAVLFSLIGAYYYLRVVKVMWFDAPAGSEPVSRTQGVTLLLAANGAAVFLFGPFSSGLMAMCRDAIVKALGS